MRKLIIAGCVFWGILSEIALAEVYRWVDENGKVHYSDKAPENAAAVKSNLTVNSERRSQIHNNQKKPSLQKANFSVLKIKRLFQRKDFNQINEVLEAYQNQAEVDITTENKLFSAYSAFELNSQTSQDIFSRWLVATPNRYQPYLARAAFYYYQGWKARGSKWAKDTKSSQFRSMNNYFSKAKSDIKKAIKLNPKIVVPYCYLIGMAKAQGSQHSADSALREALKISPATYIVRTHYMDTLLPRWGGSYTKMQAFWESAKPFAIKNKKISLLEGLPIYEAANIQMSKGNHQMAESLYDEALQFGDNERVYYKRGKNFYRMKNFEQALVDFSRAIELNSDEGEYYYWRSKTYHKLNRFGKAVFDIEKASQLAVHDDRVQKYHDWLVSQIQVRGAVTKNEQEIKDEMSTLIQAINQEPNDSRLYFRKAKLLLAQNKKQMAIRDLKKAIKLNPEEIRYYLLMDDILFKKREFNKIIEYWEQYIALKPFDSRAYLERAGTYYHQHDFDAAMKDAQKSADLGNEKAKRFYQKLKQMNK
ncbi:tetratricopeptide repeat protein [Aliikangiella coralliicola]|uniref:DUF4034 domain-containing protein n=1 Tax=Aliikangiella coralliicola TaxID=2592383 RepID=A0A545UAL6_9GAMM|nr:tetratricopeptide repeat protein [Aliikangiella coralliicola]TQV86473.1 DUF4034 domain-containing protein [Aliikangiella coralliicola]